MEPLDWVGNVTEAKSRCNEDKHCSMFVQFCGREQYFQCIDATITDDPGCDNKTTLFVKGNKLSMYKLLVWYRFTNIINN